MVSKKTGRLRTKRLIMYLELHFQVDVMIYAWERKFVY